MRTLRSHTWTAATLLVALSALPARAVDEPPRPPTSAIGHIRDLAVTVRARRALLDDPILGPLNLGVTVANGLATVWGPVPTQQVAKDAVARLKTVSGVAEVRANFYLGDTSPLDVVRPAPERVAVAKPEFETGKLPPPVREAAGPTLFAPRAVAGPKEASATVVKLPRPTTSLTDEVQVARQSEVRFRAIDVKVQGTSVLVRRGGNDGRDVMDLVQKLRRIRLVTDVILTDD